MSLEDKANFFNPLTMIQFFESILRLFINIRKSGLASIDIEYHVLCDLVKNLECGTIN